MLYESYYVFSSVGDVRLTIPAPLTLLATLEDWPAGSNEAVWIEVIRTRMLGSYSFIQYPAVQSGVRCDQLYDEFA